LNSHSVIKNCINATNANIERVEKTFSSLSSSQINWKIHPDSWSIGECLSHLINSNKLYLNKFSSILNSQPNGEVRNFSYKQTILGAMITKGVDPANVKKTKTFKLFFPNESNFEQNIIDDYIKKSKELISLTERMKHIDLKKIKFSSPANILIRLNLGDPLIFIPKHDERHLNQAERGKNHQEFPNQ
jgi:hypothetical protein